MNMPLKNFEWLLETLANCLLFHCPLILPFPSSLIFFPGSGIYRCPWTSLSKISFAFGTWNITYLFWTVNCLWYKPRVCSVRGVRSFIHSNLLWRIQELYVWLSNFLGDAISQCDLWRCTCFIFILNVFVYIKYK